MAVTALTLFLPGVLGAQRAILESRYAAATIAAALARTEPAGFFPDFLAPAGWAALPEAVRAHLLQEGERALAYAWPPLRATQHLEYQRSGDRAGFETIYFTRRERLADLVLAEMVEDQGRFIDPIIDGIWMIAEESAWCVPAHLYLQQYGFSPLPRPGDASVDLFAAETAALFAWTWHLLGDRLDAVTPIIGRRMAHEVRTRVLDPAFARDDFWWMGFKADRAVNNWNPWIISNWLPAILVFERDPERRAASVYKALRSLDYFFDAYPDDGGCDEGPSYWGHAAGSLFDCLEILRHASGGVVDIYDHPLVAAMAAYIHQVHITGDYFINFADTGARVDIRPDIVYRFGQRVGDPHMPRLAAAKARRVGLAGYIRSWWIVRKLFAPFSYAEVRALEPGEPLVADVWLPGTQLFAARDQAGSVDGFYVAAKGGHNIESHNHNDVGSYIVYYNGQPVLIDVGVETYSRKTFSPDRYEIWTMQSQYHNLPTINGVQQQDGAAFAARDVRYRADAAGAEFSLDIAGAYPAAAGVESWTRSIRLERGRELAVTEQFALSAVSAETVLNLMTSCAVEVAAPGDIRLNGGKGGAAFTLRLAYDPGQLAADVEEIAITDTRLRPVWGDSLRRLRLRVRDPAAGGPVVYALRPLTPGQR
jgi:hypothetical protein